MSNEMQTVYVVSFHPQVGGVGGFDWYYDRDVAVESMVQHLAQPGYTYIFREQAVPMFPERNEEAQERITQLVDEAEYVGAHQ